VVRYQVRESKILYDGAFTLIYRKLLIAGFFSVSLLLVNGCFHSSVVLDSSQKTSPQTIQFSGFEWLVKSSSEEVGPGPNYFSPQNVWIDTVGSLHLSINYTKSHWRCAEVQSVKQFGFGTFKITTPTNFATLNPQAVFGFFLYDTCDGLKNHEIDIEFSRWGTKQSEFGQYTFHGHTNLFKQSFHYNEMCETTHSIIRLPESINFRSNQILDSSASYSERNLVQHTILHPDVIFSGNEPVYFNLWLYEGKPLVSDTTMEVIIQKFEYEPR